MTPRDPIELFGLLDPFTDESSSEQDEARLLRIVETPVTGERDRRRFRPWVITTIVTGAVVTTAAFAVLHQQRASNPVAIVCHREANLQGDRTEVAPAADPVAACSVPWIDGTWSTSGPPRLAACVTGNGVATVFPGDSNVCAQLGLAQLEPGGSDEQQAIVALQQRLAEAFSATCFHQDESLVQATAILNASHLVGWTVQLAEAFPPGLDCGAPGVLPDAKTVIVGGGRPEVP
jgi:hypothetical protein